MIKRILCVFMISLLSITVLSGCSETESNKASELVGETESNKAKKSVEEMLSNERFVVHRIDKRTHVLIDKETHVQYLKVVRNAGFDGGVVVIPLYQANGKPFIGTEVKGKRFVTKKMDDYTFIITDKETNVQYLKVFRNAGFDGGVTVTPLLNAEGGLFISKNK